LDRLVVDDETLLAQLSGDPSIAISAFVTVEDLADLRFQVAVFVTRAESLQLVVEAAARQLSSAQQIGKREVRPQLEHDQRPFTGAERDLVRAKACTFFR
jgi:hypothetical protein